MLLQPIKPIAGTPRRGATVVLSTVIGASRFIKGLLFSRSYYQSTLRRAFF